MVRHKNRYILIEVSSNSRAFHLKQASLSRAIIDETFVHFGDFGVAAITSGFSIIYYNDITRIAIIRSRHGPHKMVNCVISLLRTIDAHDVVIRTLYIGATIKQCYKFLTPHQQRKFNEFCNRLDTAEEKQVLRDAIMNFTNTK